MTRTARATLLLVIANLAVYLVMFAGWMLRGFFPELPEKMVGLLTFPGDPRELLFVPWTSVTYMFTQISFLHLTVNMLWLAGFGAMMKGDWWQTAGAYLAGGIAGAVAFSMYTIYAGLPGEHLAGASASVIAVVAATTILTPERRVRLLFIGDIRLKWVAPIALLTVFAGFSAETAAHLGGLFAGCCAGALLRFHDKAIARRAMREARRRTMRMKILQKASFSGFASLSEEERRELFDLTRQRYSG